MRDPANCWALCKESCHPCLGHRREETHGNESPPLLRSFASALPTDVSTQHSPTHCTSKVFHTGLQKLNQAQEWHTMRWMKNKQFVGLLASRSTINTFSPWGKDMPSKIPSMISFVEFTPRCVASVLGVTSKLKLATTSSADRNLLSGSSSA